MVEQQTVRICITNDDASAANARCQLPLSSMPEPGAIGLRCLVHGAHTKAHQGTVAGAWRAGVDAAAEGVSEMKVSSPAASPASTPARAPSPAPESSANHAPSPHKDKGGTSHAAAAAEEEEDGADEEDQEARNRELRRINEELQKEDDRFLCHTTCISPCG